MRGKPITIERITKRFGRSSALFGVSLQIAAGEFVALLGPSGCGKTTLLRILAGLEDPEEGRLQIGESICFDAAARVYEPPGRRDIGLIFQSYALWPHLTVRENILFAPHARGFKDAERDLEKLLSDLKLEGLAHRYPSQLSGGQQQRVAIGRMLAARPSVFLMDEPLSNLDAALRFEMRQELRRIHDAQGATTVYVTHDQSEALAMADRVAVMDLGEIIQLGSPAEVYRRPATLKIARFLANPVVNVLASEIRGQELRVGPFPAGPAPDGVTDGPAVVTARPEDVIIGELGSSVIGMEVRALMPLGAEAIVTLERDGARVMARVSWDRRPRVGDTVAVRFPETGVNIYHPETGKRLGP